MNTLTSKISELQKKLSKGEIKIDAPCGENPVIELLGGLHARASINKTQKDKYPNVEKEVEYLVVLINLLEKTGD